MLGIRTGMLLLGCLTLLAGSLTPPLLGAAEGQPGPKEMRPGRTDRHGDPLPEGALSRLGTVRLRHAGKVNQLAFLAGGRVLASLGEDNVYHVWEAATGRELYRFARQEGSPPAPARGVWLDLRIHPMGGYIPVNGLLGNAIAFSPDGKLLAAGDQENGVELWDLVAGKQLRRLELKETSQPAVAFSPDGKLLAAAEGRETVHLWEVATGKEVRQLQWPKHSVGQLVFSPDGSTLAGVSSEEIRVWGVASGKRLRKFEGHEQAVTGLAFSADGRRLVSGGMDQAVRLWELDSEEEVAKVSGPESQVL